METEHKSLRVLEPEEIAELLRRGSHAHLGCHSRGETYVCPITYVYEDGYIFSHSLQGKKIEMMRKDPNVCLQVEEVNSLFNWKSAIVWGRFEELKGGLKMEMGLRMLKMKIAKLAVGHKLSDLEVQLDAILSNAIVFQIKVERVTGRAEDP